VRYPDPLLEALDREFIPPHQAVMDLEAAAAPLRNRRQDDHVVAEFRRNPKTRAHVDHRKPGDLEGLQQLRLAIAECLEHPDRADIEVLEVAREIDDAGGVAVTPFDADLAADGEHGFRLARSAWRCPARRRYRRMKCHNDRPTAAARAP